MKNYLILIIFVLVLSCQEDNSKDKSSAKFSSNDGSIELVQPYARPAAKGMNSAIFVKIKNVSDNEDTLYSAESSLAELVEVHETYKVTEEKMGMRHVEFVNIPAHSELLLKPRSFHIMLIDLNEDLKIGSDVQAKLLFKKAGAIEITAIVKDILNNSNK